MKSSLILFGLNEEEASVYLSLLKGNSSISLIAQTAEVSRTKVYDILDRLTVKGWTEMVSEKPLRYAPKDPKPILDNIRENYESALSLMFRELPVRYEGMNKERRDIFIYRGSRVVTKVSEMLCRTAEEAIFVGAFIPMEAVKMVIPIIERMLNRGVRVKALVSEELMASVKAIKSSRSLPVVPEKDVLVIDMPTPHAGIAITDRKELFLASFSKESFSLSGLSGIWSDTPELLSFFLFMIDQAFRIKKRGEKQIIGIGY